MARRTLMETCGIQCWGRSWNASCALAPTAPRSANESRVPASTHASIPWRQQGNAARRVKVAKRTSDRNKLCERHPCNSSVFCFFPLERKAESNQTHCHHGYKNNLLVYKVESSVRVDEPDTVRIIAVERQSTAEVEVQVWKTVEGTAKTWLLIWKLLHQHTTLIRALHLRRHFAINGNRGCPEKRYYGSSRKLHLTYKSWWRFVFSLPFLYNTWWPDTSGKLIMNFAINWCISMLIQVLLIFSETWRKFKEEGETLSNVPQTAVCENGIQEIVRFLNPTQIEGLCSP